MKFIPFGQYLTVRLVEGFEDKFLAFFEGTIVDLGHRCSNDELQPGDRVVFHRTAERIPGESSLFVLPISSVVGRVVAEDTPAETSPAPEPEASNESSAPESETTPAV